jgi:hypothetical protein
LLQAPLDEANIGRLMRLLREMSDAVHHHHPLEENHGIRAGDVRRDYAGAGRFATGVGEVPRARARSGGAGGVGGQDRSSDG